MIDIHKRTDPRGVRLNRPSAADIIRRIERREWLWAALAAVVMAFVGYRMGIALAIEASL